VVFCENDFVNVLIPFIRGRHVRYFSGGTAWHVLSRNTEEQQ
jgi:hypothetical protein